jgi:hypothetical protein
MSTIAHRRERKWSGDSSPGGAHEYSPGLAARSSSDAARAPGQAPPKSPALKGRNLVAGARQSHRYCSSYSIPCFFNKLRNSISNNLSRWCSPCLVLFCRSRAIPIPPFQGGEFWGTPPGARTASLRLRVASPGLYSQAPPGPRIRTPRFRVHHRSWHGNPLPLRRRTALS